jgi:hypothetical protein
LAPDLALSSERFATEPTVSTAWTQSGLIDVRDELHVTG